MTQKADKDGAEADGDSAEADVGAEVDDGTTNLVMPNVKCVHHPPPFLTTTSSIRPPYNAHLSPTFNHRKG